MGLRITAHEDPYKDKELLSEADRKATNMLLQGDKDKEAAKAYFKVKGSKGKRDAKDRARELAANILNLPDGLYMIGGNANVGCAYGAGGDVLFVFDNRLRYQGLLKTVYAGSYIGMDKNLTFQISYSTNSTSIDDLKGHGFNAGASGGWGPGGGYDISIGTNGVIIHNVTLGLSFGFETHADYSYTW